MMKWANWPPKCGTAKRRKQINTEYKNHFLCFICVKFTPLPSPKKPHTPINGKLQQIQYILNANYNIEWQMMIFDRDTHCATFCYHSKEKSFKKIQNSFLY